MKEACLSQENYNWIDKNFLRKQKTRGIPKTVEKNIFEKLFLEKKLIEDKEVPIRPYDYSYIKDLLERDHK